jgi:hypothetical protein
MIHRDTLTGYDTDRRDYADENTTDTALTRHNDPAGHITPPST